MIKKTKTAIKKILEVSFGVYNLCDHFVINYFDKSSVIVDLGAGKGEFSSCILRKFPCCRIILVEPAPSQVKEIAKKFESQKKIEILEAAIGNKTNNNARFYLGKNWEENSLHKSLIVGKEDQTEIKIRVVTLKDIFSLYHLEKIDLLKVDIEGAEWDVLENFSKLDFERISQISVEFHDFLDPSLRLRTDRSVRILKELGYSFIYAGTGYMYGTPYSNCLFYDKRRLKRASPAKWVTIPKRISDKL